jgi:hypothetical protein
MKRVLVALAAAGFLVVALIAVADATQNRHDTDRHDGTSTLELHVSTKRGFAPEAAAHSLWAACQPTVLGNRLVSLDALPEPGMMAVAVAPALGEHARRRLVGCLEDATVDLVSARVHRVTNS